VAAASYAKTPVFGTFPPLVESFSATGPDTILFDTLGNAISATVSPIAFTGVDGVDTSFFGKDSDSDLFPNFFGTSAAAPSAAAVAALMLQLNAGPDRVDPQGDGHPDGQFQHNGGRFGRCQCRSRGHNATLERRPCRQHGLARQH